MKIEDIVIIILSIATFIITLCSLFILNNDKRERNRKIRKLHREEEVERFRNMMARKYGTKGLLAMPDFEYMVEDNRELTEENYVNL